MALATGIGAKEICACEACESACVPSTATGARNTWKYKFAREAIKAHLLNVGRADGSVTSFKSVEDIEFQRYLARTRPYFVVAHDGGDIMDSEDVVEEDRLSKRAPLLENVKKWLDMGFNVVLTNDVAFLDSKVGSLLASAIFVLISGLDIRSSLGIPYSRT